MRESLPKIWCVARNEFQAAVRSKAFIIGVLMTPLLIGVSVLVQKLAEKGGDISDRTFAVIDHTGSMFEVLQRRAGERDKLITHKGEDGSQHQTAPRFIPIEPPSGADGKPMSEISLSAMVRDEVLFAYVVIGEEGAKENPAAGGDELTPTIAYHTNTPTYQELPQWIRSAVDDELRERRYKAAGVDPKLVERLNKPVGLRQFGLAEKTADDGTVAAKESNRAAAFAVPAGTVVLLFVLVMMSAPVLLNTVLEEKISRVAELLLASVTPFELMFGKVLGAVLVTLTLTIVYMGAIIYMLSRFGLMDAVPLHMYAWFAFFLLLAVMMYGSLFAAIGAACSEIRDAQALMTPVMLIAMLPMFCWSVVLQSPGSTFSVAASLFPPATPMLMLLRIGLSPSPPVWQVALGVVLTLGFTLLCIAAGAKVFRIGILSYGQTPSIRRIIGWLISK